MCRGLFTFSANAYQRLSEVTLLLGRGFVFNLLCAFTSFTGGLVCRFLAPPLYGMTGFFGAGLRGATGILRRFLGFMAGVFHVLLWTRVL